MSYVHGVGPQWPLGRQASGPEDADEQSASLVHLGAQLAPRQPWSTQTSPVPPSEQSESLKQLTGIPRQQSWIPGEPQAWVDCGVVPCSQSESERHGPFKFPPEQLAATTATRPSRTTRRGPSRRDGREAPPRPGRPYRESRPRYRRGSERVAPRHRAGTRGRPRSWLARSSLPETLERSLRRQPQTRGAPPAHRQDRVE
jgi:hypothetical protein